MNKLNSKLFTKLQDAKISEKASSMIKGGAFIATSSGRPNSSDCTDTSSVTANGDGYQKDTTFGACK
jgi:hypothetical protein